MGHRQFDFNLHQIIHASPQISLKLILGEVQLVYLAGLGIGAGKKSTWVAAG